MKKSLTLLGCCLALASCASGGRREGLRDDRVYVEVETTMGDMLWELDPASAPVGVANFLTYASRGDYDGTVFHRVVPGFVIQGGGHLPDLTELPGDDPIVNEWQNGLKNVRGSIGWARESEPDSATRQWYINLADNERLDIGREVSGGAGYAVFGRVVEGMGVVDAIAAVETYDQEGEGEDVMANIPVTAVIVERVRVVEPG